MRLAEKLDGWSRAAIGRRLGEAVIGGKDMMSAVVGMFEELQTAPGQVVPIGMLEDVNRKEVSIEGRVTQLGSRRVQPFPKWDSSKTKVDGRNSPAGLRATNPGLRRANTFVFTERRRTGTTGVSRWL